MTRRFAPLFRAARPSCTASRYAEDAKAEGEDKYAGWFAQRARERLAELRRDWNDVSVDLNLREHEDDVAELLMCHVEKDIERVRLRIEKV